MNEYFPAKLHVFLHRTYKEIPVEVRKPPRGHTLIQKPLPETGLFDFNHPVDFGLFLGCAFRQVNRQHAVVHAGRNLVLIDIFRQDERLFELSVRKFLAQITLVLLVLLFLLIFLLHRDGQLVVLAHMNREVFLLHAGGCNFNLVVRIAFNDIDCGGGGVCLYQPIVVEEIIKQTRQPVLTIVLSNISRADFLSVAPLTYLTYKIHTRPKKLTNVHYPD